MFRRFFAIKKELSDEEIDFFLNVDFQKHVALVATAERDGKTAIIGGGRFVVVRPGAAEVAFAVIDDFQGKGLGTILMRHLAAIARATELRTLVAEVLPENKPMLKVIEKSGLPMTTRREAGVVHVNIALV